MKKLIILFCLSLGSICLFANTSREYKEKQLELFGENPFKNEASVELTKVRKQWKAGDKIAQKEWREYTEIMFDGFVHSFAENEEEIKEAEAESKEMYGDDFKLKAMEEMFGEAFDEYEKHI